MTATSVQDEARKSTRRHRCDEDFLELLEQDYGIAQFSLRQAFLGMPPAPKKQAIEVCEWAVSNSMDPDGRGRMVRGWAKNRKVGQYHPAIIAAPPATFDGRTGFELEGV